MWVSSFPHLKKLLDRGAKVFAISISALMLALIVQDMRSKEAAGRVQHTYRVIDAINGLRVSLLDRETGLRGYVLTGDAALLAQPPRCRGDCPDVRRLLELIRDNPVQQRALGPLPGLIEAYEQDVAALKARVEEGARPEAERMVGDRVGKRYLDPIRQALDAAEAAERQLLAVRHDAHARQERLLSTGLLGGALLMAGALLALYVKSRAAISAGVRIEAQMRALSLSDALTGLPNRRYLEEHARRMLEQAGREKRPVAVLAVDLDGFKSVNEEFGHPAGDELLVEAANRIKACMRHVDLVARVGGDEFTVVLGSACTTQATQAAGERIVSALCRPIVLSGGATVAIGASVGAVLVPSERAGVAELFEMADRALIEAKRAGRQQAPLAGSRSIGPPGAVAAG